MGRDGTGENEAATITIISFTVFKAAERIRFRYGKHVFRNRISNGEEEKL